MADTPGYPNKAGTNTDPMQPKDMPVAGSQSSNSSILPPLPTNSTEGVPGDKDKGKSLDSLWAKSAGSC